MVSKYLAYLFQSPSWRKQIRKKANGVKVYSITQKMLKDTYVLVPPTDEQNEIVAHLDYVCQTIDALVEKENSKIKSLQDLKDRIVADVITGKVDVREVEIPEYEFVADLADDISDEENEMEEIDVQEE